VNQQADLPASAVNIRVYPCTDVAGVSRSAAVGSVA